MEFSTVIQPYCINQHPFTNSIVMFGLTLICLFVYLGQCMLINISKKLKKENMPGYNNIANLHP